jgi:hypothetical protein
MRWAAAVGWAKPGRGPVGRAPFLSFLFFSFSPSSFFYNFCILAPNELKPISKFF